MAMERTLKKIVWITAMVVIATGGNINVASQSPTSGCTAPLLSLSPCSGFLNASNRIPSASPTQGCCSALASLLQTSATCFCQLVSSLPSNPFPIPFGFPINQTQALMLPGSCKMTTAQCKAAAGAPANAPASSPSRGAGATTANGGTQLAPAPSTTTTTRSQGPSATFPPAPSPSMTEPTSEAGALYMPSFLMVSTGLILGCMIW